jgi:signal peptidase II
MSRDHYALWYVSLVSCIIALDQLTKLYFYSTDAQYTLTSFLSLQVHMNRGISWGMFHSEHTAFFFFITFVITCFIGGFLYHTYQRYGEGHAIVAECAVLGGAISNVIDRFVHAGVIDFIVVSWKGWTFPVFNVADVAIVVGIFFIMLEGLRHE